MTNVEAGVSGVASGAEISGATGAGLLFFLFFMYLASSNFSK